MTLTEGLRLIADQESFLQHHMLLQHWVCWIEYLTFMHCPIKVFFYHMLRECYVGFLH